MNNQQGEEKEEKPEKKIKVNLGNIKNQFIEFGKNIKKAAHKANAKLGIVDITPDHEYDQLKMKFKESHRAAKNAAAHSKSFADQFFAFSASVSLVFRDLEAAYDPNDPMVPYIRRIFQKLDEYDLRDVKNYVCLHSQLLEQVLDSIVQYRQEMDNLKKVMKERDEAKMKYDVLRTKMRKLVEKRNKEPAKTAEKMEKVRDELRSVEKEYTAMNTSCKSQMLEAINSRGVKIDPVIPKLTGKLISMIEDLHNVAKSMHSVALETSDKKFTRNVLTLQDVPQQDPHQSSSNHNSNQSNGSDTEESDSAPKPQQQTKFEPRKLSSAPAMEANPFQDLEWFYLDDGVQQQGPVTFEKLKQLFRSNAVTNDTYVFAGEMDNWKQVSDIPKLKQFL